MTMLSRTSPILFLLVLAPVLRPATLSITQFPAPTLFVNDYYDRHVDPKPNQQLSLLKATGLSTTDRPDHTIGFKVLGEIPAGLDIQYQTGFLSSSDQSTGSALLYVSGTPAKAGDFKLTLHARVTEAEAVIDVLNDIFEGRTPKPDIVTEIDVNIEIIVVNNPAPVQITTDSSLPDAAPGFYKVQLQAQGGTPPYTWNMSSGAPNFLGLTPDGIFVGYAYPDQASNTPYTFTASATDQLGVAGAKDFTVRVVSVTPFIITNRVLPDAPINVPYTVLKFSAVGGSGPYTWQLVDGSLPKGLTLSSDGTLQGSPVETKATPYAFTVKVTDAKGNTYSDNFQLLVRASLLSVSPDGEFSIDTDVMVRGSLKRSYTAAGGGPPYKFDIKSGNLPDGVPTISSNGLLAGVPTKAGTYDFVVRATDSNGFVATYEERINVLESCDLPDAYERKDYDYTVPSQCVTSCPTDQSPAPDGMTLDGCRLHGKPTYKFKYFTFNSLRAAQSGTPLTINIWPHIDANPKDAVLYLRVGNPFSYHLAAVGGRVPWRDNGFTYSLDPGNHLPDGLLLSTDGLIAGIPTTAGQVGVSIRAEDGFSLPDSANLQMFIYDGPRKPVAISPGQTLPTATPGKPFSARLLGQGSNMKWRLAPDSSLPPGLALSLDGLISGIPAPVGAGARTVTLKLVLSGDTSDPVDTASFDLRLDPPATQPLQIIGGSLLPRGVVAKGYAVSLQALAGVPPYKWRIATGALPSGVQLYETGLITGFPSQASSTTFTVEVLDVAGITQSQAMTLNVSATSPWVIDAPAQLVFGLLGYYYADFLHVSDPAVQGKWEFVSGDSLSAFGLKFGADGFIKGTLSQVGTIHFRARFTSGALADERDFAIDVISSTTGAPFVLSDAIDIDTSVAPVQQLMLAAGGRPKYVWQMTGLTAPSANLTIISSPDGFATTQGGIPAAGVYPATLQLRDDAGAVASRSILVSTTNAATESAILTPPLAVAHVGDDAHAFPALKSSSALGGNVSFAAIDGSRVAGYGLSSAGAINGVALQAGSYGFLLSASGDRGSATKHFHVVILPQISIPQNLPAATVGAPYTYALSAAAVLGPVNWQWSDAAGQILAASPVSGLQLDTDRGLIAGIPAQAGTYQLWVRATTAFSYGPGRPSPVIPLLLICGAKAGGGGSGGGSAKSVITSPAPGSTLPGSSVTFTWTAVPNAALYVLGIGRNTDATDLYFSGQDLQTSVTVNNLPTDGSTLYVKLFTKVGNDYQTSDYTYRAASGGGSGGGSTKAVITSPAPGSTLAGSSVTFTWTAVPNAALYVLGIGRTPDATDVYFSGQDLHASVTVNNLPTDGNTLYVKLFTKLGNDYQTSDSTYTAASGGGSGGGNTKAAITSPVPGSTLTGASVTFTWTAVPNAALYVLGIGRTADAMDIYFSGQDLRTSVTVNNLPTDGSTLYVKLFTKLGNDFQIGDYTYKAASGGGSGVGNTKAVITSPAPGSTLSGSSVAFTWTTVPNAALYVLGIGRNTDATDLYFSGQDLRTSVTVNNLPTDGSTLFVKLFTKLGNDYQTSDYTYKAATVAATGPSISTKLLPSGVAGQPYSQSLAESGGTKPFIWSVVAGALPSGLALATSGVISGVPLQSGTFTLTVKVVDSNNSSDTQAYTLVIAPAPTLVILTVSLQAGRVGQLYSQTLLAAGGIPPYIWSTGSGTLPNGLPSGLGLTLDSSGFLSGVPLTSGTFNVRFNVVDSIGNSDSKTITLVIAK